nr:hypothetical protein [Klebsiella pneumoniae]
MSNPLLSLLDIDYPLIQAPTQKKKKKKKKNHSSKPAQNKTLITQHTAF